MGEEASAFARSGNERPLRFVVDDLGPEARKESDLLFAIAEHSQAIRLFSLQDRGGSIRLEFDDFDDQDDQALFRTDDMLYGVWPLEQYRRAARPLAMSYSLEEADALRKLLLAGTRFDLRADGLVSLDPMLREYQRRDEGLVRPAEAVALCGLLLRQRGAFFCPTVGGLNVNMSAETSYVIAVEVHLPQLLRLRKACDINDQTFYLACSLSTRMYRLLRARDWIQERAHMEPEPSTGIEAAMFLDYFLLCAVGLFDALARLVNRVYEVGAKPEFAGWMRPWLAQLNEKDETLPEFVRMSSAARVLPLLGALRNTVHSVAMEAVHHDDGSRTEWPLEVPTEVAASALERAAVVGNPEEWGLQDRGHGTWLHPDLFVEAACPAVLLLLREFLVRLDYGRFPDPTSAEDEGRPFSKHFGTDEDAERVAMMVGV